MCARRLSPSCTFALERQNAPRPPALGFVAAVIITRKVRHSVHSADLAGSHMPACLLMMHRQDRAKLEASACRWWATSPLGTVVQRHPHEHRHATAENTHTTYNSNTHASRRQVIVKAISGGRPAQNPHSPRCGVGAWGRCQRLSSQRLTLHLQLPSAARPSAKRPDSGTTDRCAQGLASRRRTWT